MINRDSTYKNGSRLVAVSRFVRLECGGTWCGGVAFRIVAKQMRNKALQSLFKNAMFTINTKKMIDVTSEVLQPANIDEAELRLDLALMLYQKGKFTIGQARKLANLDIFAFQEALANHDVCINYGLTDYQSDLQTIQKLRLRNARH